MRLTTAVSGPNNRVHFTPAGASGAVVGGEGAHGTLQSKASDCLRCARLTGEG